MSLKYEPASEQIRVLKNDAEVREAVFVVKPEPQTFFFFFITLEPRVA